MIALSLATALPGLVKTGRSKTALTTGAARAVAKLKAIITAQIGT